MHSFNSLFFDPTLWETLMNNCSITATINCSIMTPDHKTGDVITICYDTVILIVLWQMVTNNAKVLHRSREASCLTKPSWHRCARAREMTGHLRCAFWHLPHAVSKVPIYRLRQEIIDPSNFKISQSLIIISCENWGEGEHDSFFFFLFFPPSKRPTCQFRPVSGLHVSVRLQVNDVVWRVSVIDWTGNCCIICLRCFIVYTLFCCPGRK